MVLGTDRRAGQIAKYFKDNRNKVSHWQGR